MGIWAFYRAYKKEDWDIFLNKDKDTEQRSLPEEQFSIDIGKAYYGLHKILAGSEEPVVGNIFSLALAGEQFAWASDLTKDDLPFFWWDTWFGAAWLSPERVAEIASAFADADFSSLLKKSEWVEDSNYCTYHTHWFEELRGFYQKAAQDGLAVRVVFG